jgi:protein-S-isoprenylcysteine O-methyltransferase Ste14
MTTKISNWDELEADIDRWFSRSPFGVLLQGEDGRAWRLSDEQEAALRQQAKDDILEFVAWQKRRQFLGLLLLLTLAYFFDELAAFSLGVGMPWLMIPVGLVCFVPMMPFVWLFILRRRQRTLKRNFILSLGNATPLTEDIAVNYIRKNRYSYIGKAVFFCMMLIIIVAEQFAPRTTEEMIGVTGIIVFVIGGILLVWALQFLGKINDKKNRL